MAAVLAVSVFLTGCVGRGAAPKAPAGPSQPAETGGGQSGGTQPPNAPVSSPAITPAPGARVEFKEVHSYEVDGELWTVNFKHTISPGGKWVLAAQTDATGVKMAALPLDAAAGKVHTLHSADRNWTSNHLFGYYPLGWASETRCLFAVQGWQNIGPHKGKRGVAVFAGDVGKEPAAAAEEVAFIGLSKGLLRFGGLALERKKAYFHVSKAIWEFDVATSKLRQVKGNLPDYEGLFFPKLSPDGRYLAYDLRERNAHGVYLLDTETGQQKPLLPTGETMSFYPFWSPDGKYVAAYAVNKKKGANSSTQPGQGINWQDYDLLEGEDGPQAASDAITVVNLEGKVVQTIKVEGKKLSYFRWGSGSNAIGFVVGKSGIGGGGIEQILPESLWLVASGDALSAGASGSPIRAATITREKPDENVYVIIGAVDSDGAGIVYNEYRTDISYVRHARLESSKAEPDKMEAAFSGWGMDYVYGNPMVGVLEGAQWSAVWAFQPTGMSEIARFGPNRHTMVLGYNGDVLAIANCPFWSPDMAKPGAKVEKAVMKAYRVVKTDSKQ